MKLAFRFLSICSLAVIQTATASTVVFTTDTIIAPNDATYDGSDVVISNCVLTVDGPHNFVSVRVAGTGVLTHTASPTGQIPAQINVTNEAYTLSGTNAVTLNNPNVNLASVVVTDSTGTTNYTNNVDYVLTPGPGTLTSLRRTDTSSIPDGSIVLLSYSYTGAISAGLVLNVSGDVEVEPPAKVDVIGRGNLDGSGAGNQTGFPSSGSGGGYGGYGGTSSSNAAPGVAFGSPFEPDQLGSGGGAGDGGPGASGGGRVRLLLGGNLILNGAILVNGANATNSRAGGGSGGSVWVTASLLLGTGTITANGGAGEPIHGGGGGGGRIALEFATNNFSGTVAALGGPGWQRGGAGTLFSRLIGTPGLVTFDNGGNPGAVTLLQFGNTADLIVQGRAVAVVSSSQVVSNLVIRTNCSIVTTVTNNATLILTALGDATIEAGGSIPLDGRGAPQNTGAGVGSASSVVGAGAGHGGFGGSGQSPAGFAAGGIIYDSTTTPTIVGSGGRNVTGFNGGAGGGALRLNVSGNLRLDGRISADATSGTGASGGGSGGSIWLALGGFSGSGTISANGGAGGLPYGGGGGGGRIAVTYQSNTFTGNFVAHGGNGAVPGGAGTIFTKPNNVSSANITMDNSGFRGAGTILDQSSLLALQITGGAVATSSIPNVTVTNLNIGANSAWLSGNFASLNVTVNGSGNIAGAFSSDGTGTSGIGQGLPSPTGSGGGGLGGAGGSGAGAAGGAIFGLSSQPTNPGGRGGSAFGNTIIGGGGVLRLTVTGLLTVDGRITANGQTVNSNNNGGGAGGSIWLTVGGLAGAGAIVADAGSGNLPFGGGGGGGRIAIYYNSNSFAGTYSAKGGAGFVNGGAGTIYLKPTQSLPTFIVDNGGLPGTSTAFDPNLTGLTELRVLNGAYLTSSISSTLTLSNLTVGSNATMVGWFPGLRMNVSGNATVAGLLSAMAGASGGSGSGMTSQSGSGGGGYGGAGGRGAGANGGIAFDSSSNPKSSGGSGGGLFAGQIAQGGGYFQMTVAKSLTVDGIISVNGMNGPTNNGGGAGGGILLTVGGLAGAGAITADGGAGNLPLNGGGGGGRIAVYYTSNSFIGTYSAKGGVGFANGGAGTLYLKAATNQLPIFIADNGGLQGTNTYLDTSLTSLLELRVLNGAYLTSSITSTLNVSNLTVGSNATMVGWFPGLRMNVSGEATIAGLLAAAGSSANSFLTSSPLGSGGGGHGGAGGRGAGAPGGPAFDSIAQPTSWGNPGASTTFPPAPGGGYLQMSVAKMLKLNGVISANGANGATNGGGGAGGGILLTVGGLAGTGTISADGGAGGLPGNGGGGGGRIALYYTSNSFSGTFSAKGGLGFANGGAGTVYLKANNSQLARLLVDNGGVPAGTNTLWDNSAGSLSDVTITSGSVISTLSSFSLQTLTVGPNSALLLAPSAFMQLGSASVGAGGSISADGANTVLSLGQGASSSSGSGGGGHAGYGGSGFGAPGGNSQGFAVFPTTQGGRGGGSFGGAGGGAIRIITSSLKLDGRISANGLNISSNNSGGGAGGSVWLSGGTFSGSGMVSANGGSGNLPAGGGGGGGRISISFTSNTFNGFISAVGGAGFVRGGAGTIYTVPPHAQFADILLDNGGIPGTITDVSPSSGYNLTVQSGAIATGIGTPGTAASPHDVLVRSNAWISQTGAVGVSHNATFEPGGGLMLDGLGNDGGGTGFNSLTQAGGGGHGGYGGLHTQFFGQAYDSVRNPTRGGSAGGNGSGTTISPLGGLGGGAVHLTVGNILQLDGAITSSGKDGNINSGGGSGGSVWLSAQTFTGAGMVSAQGGNGNGSGGGGAGGRIAIYYNSNTFSGTVLACGGGGSESGGAGTVYLQANSQANGQLLLDNCGNSGATTPLSQSFGLPPVLSVGDGAIGEFQGTLPVMSNIVVSAGGALTGSLADTNVNLIVLGDMSVQAGGAFALDGKGFSQANGLGAGATFNNSGGGGGYGGVGGLSSLGATGGVAYGSSALPVDRGSGGGLGLGPVYGGSSGGGALRLQVSGQLTIDGSLSADGMDGFQDNSGGGSGGSIWLTARTLAGAGSITANGGAGEPFQGGGGGGGRIAIYSRTNTLSGSIAADGGPGAFPGASGTILLTNIPLPAVIAQIPSDVVSYAVSNVDLTFGSLMNGITAVPSDFVLVTPDGLVPQTDFTVNPLDLTTIRLSFPPEDTVGYYEIHAGPGIEDVFGQSMAGAYIGSFLIFPPTIAGHVTDTNGAAVAFVTLKPAPDLLPVVTDSHGAYAIEVVPGWNGTITPSKGTAAFLPPSRAYVNVGSDMTNENYVLVSPSALVLNGQQQGPNLRLSYTGVQGVTYQMMSSTNLVDWVPYGDPVVGTNGLIELLAPCTADPLKFFRFKANP